LSSMSGNRHNYNNIKLYDTGKAYGFCYKAHAYPGGRLSFSYSVVIH
jgi:hypothetical protein